jgi:DNA polymerase
MRIHLDLELASPLRLDEVGVDVWSKHKDTVPVVCGFAVDDDPVQNFTFGPPSASLGKLLLAVQGGAEIHAWNATFERTVWNNLLAPRYVFPRLPVERFHCTMAAAACAGLPMGLDDAALAAGASHVKDKSGQALMKRMARPRAFHADGTPRWWHDEDMGKLRQLIDYNRADVEAERAVWRLIPRMTRRERQIWLVDQHMNERGMPVDQDLIGALSAITLEELLKLNPRLAALTNNEVISTAQNSKLLAWLKNQGYPHDTLGKDTLLDFMGSAECLALPFRAREALAVRAEAAKTSTAKLRALSNFRADDGRARNLVQYGGAVRTLRWAGRGPQIQNFPRPITKHVKTAIENILGGLDGGGIRVLFGRPLDVVSSCLRGVFKAPKGYAFVVCDYHAIEAIVLAYLADFKSLLDVFRRGEDIYTFTAQSVGSPNRQFGKVLRLACGYGMGAPKFRKTAKTYGLDLGLVEAERAVHAYRAANQPIVDLWYAYESGAREAIMHPGVSFWRNGIGFRRADPKGRLAGSLLIEKPSGGNLVYRNVRLHSGRITYDGVNQFTRQWGPQETYGGKLVENVTQAVARDLLADAMVTYDRALPGTLVTTIHDEIVALVKKEHADGALGVLKKVMSTPPDWAPGMPLSASGYVADRYAKA